MGRNRLAQSGRCGRAALAVAELACDKADLFKVRLGWFAAAISAGSWAEAQEAWNLLDAMGRNWSKAIYSPGEAEYWFAWFQHDRGFLTEAEIDHVERLCKEGNNRRTQRDLHRLRGQWHQDRREWRKAAESFGEALRMAREVGQEDRLARAGLALARLHLGEVEAARDEAEAISREVTGLFAIAELWAALGERERAVQHALACYRWAWADGEPYVLRFELERAKALLQTLGVEAPVLDPYDPAKDGKYPMEDEINAAIEKLRAEKAAEQEAGKDSGDDSART
jgi:hypothetical protein